MTRYDCASLLLTPCSSLELWNEIYCFSVYPFYILHLYIFTFKHFLFLAFIFYIVSYIFFWGKKERVFLNLQQEPEEEQNDSDDSDDSDNSDESI